MKFGLKNISIGLIILLLIELITFLFFQYSSLTQGTLVEMIANHVLLIAAILSNLHLFMRAQGYESTSSTRKYMVNMSLFFIPIAIFSIFYITNTYFLTYLNVGLFDYVNTLYPDLNFNFFGSSIHVRIPFNSILLFGLVISSLIFILYPIEHFVKQQKAPWHTYSTIFILLLMVMLVFQTLVSNEFLVSLVLVVIVLILLVNVIFLFWTYFAVAIKAPPSPLKTGGYVVAISLIMLILSWVATVFIKDLISTLWLSELVTYIIAGSPIILLNIGFFILRPINVT
jgi:hypothetical protein